MNTNLLQFLSDGSVKDLHKAIGWALEEDDKSGHSKLFDVRQERDWRIQADKLEEIMRKRHIDFVPIPW